MVSSQDGLVGGLAGRLAAACGGPRGRRRAAAFIAAAVFLAVGMFLGAGWLRPAPSSKAIGGPFTLTATDGQRLTDRGFRGKWLLIYFGYTHCPDICPTTLTDIGQTLDRLGPLAAELQPFFVTIDPERDTPATMAAYLQAFDSRIVGLSGTPAEIAVVAREYRVYYARQEASPRNGDSYLMEHTAFVYVIGPDGNYVTLLAPLQGQTPDDMAVRLRDLMVRQASE